MSSAPAANTRGIAQPLLTPVAAIPTGVASKADIERLENKIDRNHAETKTMIQQILDKQEMIDNLNNDLQQTPMSGADATREYFIRSNKVVRGLKTMKTFESTVMAYRGLQA
jgi:tRNA U34 5-carboxymethylaminomethyl modifying GTPase MnmE/TrmE